MDRPALKLLLAAVEAGELDVIAIVSAQNIEFVKGRGADEAIDYKAELLEGAAHDYRRLRRRRRRNFATLLERSEKGRTNADPRVG